MKSLFSRAVVYGLLILFGLLCAFGVAQRATWICFRKTTQLVCR